MAELVEKRLVTQVSIYLITHQGHIYARAFRRIEDAARLVESLYGVELGEHDLELMWVDSKRVVISDVPLPNGHQHLVAHPGSELPGEIVYA